MLFEQRGSNPNMGVLVRFLLPHERYLIEKAATEKTLLASCTFTTELEPPNCLSIYHASVPEAFERVWQLEYGCVGAFLNASRTLFDRSRCYKPARLAFRFHCFFVAS